MDKNELITILLKQLSLFSIDESELSTIKRNLSRTVERVQYCFEHNPNKYYFNEGNIHFNPYHSGQWCTFLYFLGNTIFNDNQANSVVCDKIYYLNKMLNSCDLFYEVQLPKIFFLDHPVGSVIGRGTFGDYFSFSQGCTIGNNKGRYPVIGEHVKMLSDSKIIGNCIIGNNVIVSANTYIKDETIPENSIVFGQSPNLILKKL